MTACVRGLFERQTVRCCGLQQQLLCDYQERRPGQTTTVTTTTTAAAAAAAAAAASISGVDEMNAVTELQMTTARLEQEQHK